MKAGPRRHRVLLQRAVDTQDETTGEPVRSWVNVGYWHCEIEPLRGSEGLVDGGVRDSMDSRLRGNYSRQVASLRAKDRGIGSVDGLVTYYNFIGAPLVASDKKLIEIRARSGLNDGG